MQHADRWILFYTPRPVCPMAPYHIGQTSQKRGLISYTCFRRFWRMQLSPFTMSACYTKQSSSVSCIVNYSLITTKIAQVADYGGISKAR